MAWAGGTFTRANGANEWVTDFNNGVGIEPARHDTQDNDLATGINQCLNKDGSNSMTGNLNLNNNIPTNIGAGTAAAPALCVGGDVNTGVFGPAADTWAVSTNGAERVRINTSGQIGLNTTAPANSLDIATTSTTPAQIGMNITAYNTDTGRCAEINLFKSNNVTNGSNTLVTNGTYLGAVRFYGANGTTFNQSALIAAAIDGTPGATNDMPARLEFYTSPDGAAAPIERMRIDSAGDVGIGINSISGVRTTIRVDTNSKVPLRTESPIAGDVGTPGLSINKADNNTGTGQNFIYFAINNWSTGSGKINANGAGQAAFGTLSDARTKENIVDLPSQLNNVLNLRPVEFDYKNGSGHQIGFIAQEVQEIYPDLVGESEGYLTLSDLNKNDARLIKAIQELNAKVEALQARVEELEGA